MTERNRDYGNNPMPPAQTAKKVVGPGETRGNNPVPPKPQSPPPKPQK
jgi:hypothetical protein